MILRIILVAALCFCTAQGVLNKELKRREAFDSYGPPPRPAPQYGPPPQRQPHREYGVPQQIPFREYGAPALKYGPPKLNFLSGGGSSSSGFYEQIKNHFGVPKPHYGPPHRPSPSYGPPPHQPQQQYGPPKPAPSYGPPPQIHRPQNSYGPPPKPIYGAPHPPQALPLIIPSPAFRPEHQPASSYGPPPSGPILPQKQTYGPPPSPPQSNYGPPPLPDVLPNTQPPQFNRVQETTIVVTGDQNQQSHQFHHPGGPVKQVQIQIDGAGHTHSVSGSQAPFHTACDGWKPISAPVGSFVEHNNIESQGGYNQVQQGFGSNGFTTQYSSSSGANSAGSFLDSLTDEQLVAIALQSDASNGGNNVLGIQSAGQTNDFKNNQNLNTIENEALQLALGSLDDSYSKPPTDSFAPGSIHAQKFNGPVDSYGAPASGDFGPHPPPILNSQPNKPVAYRPPVPQGLLESIGATVAHLDQFGVRPPIQPDTYIPPAVNEIPASGPGNIDNEYGPPPPLPPTQALPLQAHQPQEFLEQQLPQPTPPQYFVQVNQQTQSYQPPQFSYNRPQLTFQTQNQQQSPPQFNFLPPLQEPRNQYVPPPPPPPPQNQYLPARPAVTQLRPVPPPPNPQYLPPPPPPPQAFYQQSASSTSAFTSSAAGSEQFIHTQGLPVQQSVQFNHVHDCGHGPNLIGTNFQVQQQQQQQLQQQQFQGQQQQNYANAGSSNAYNAITQSIPVAESHTQILEAPNDSYGPPASGNDHEGYASQHSSVAALPDGSIPQNLPGLEGLDGLNVISAQKSQSVEISSNQPTQNRQNKYQLELTDNSGNQGAHHEEILSQDLLQSILSAIEEPKSQQAQNQYQPQAPNHNYGNVYNAQSRSDNNAMTEENEQDGEVAEASKKNEVRVEPASDDNTVDKVNSTKIEPIVPEEVPKE